MLLCSHRQSDGEGASFSQFDSTSYVSAQVFQGSFRQNQPHSGAVLIVGAAAEVVVFRKIDFGFSSWGSHSIVAHAKLELLILHRKIYPHLPAGMGSI